MFCSKCGENLAEGTIFCPKCGTNAGGKNNVNNNYQPVQQIAIGGWVALVLGLVGIIYPLITILNNWAPDGISAGFYDWDNIPKGLSALLIISLIVFVIGVIFLIKQKHNVKVQKKQTQKEQTIVNNGDKSSIGFAILSFFIPLVGLILFLVWKKDTPMKAKSCGKGALIGFILSVVQVIFFVMKGKNLF
jgi:uncharacterized membrane protein YvbJ